MYTIIEVAKKIFTFFLPYNGMSDFINNINLVRKNWVPSEAWEIELLKNQQKDKILREKYPPNQQERIYAQQYGKTVVNCIDKLDQYSINKSADAMIAIGTLFSLPTILSPIIGGTGGYLVSKLSKNLKNQKKLTSFNGAMIGAGLYFIFSEYLRAQLEKITTRIARFQARNNDLRDYSNFVIHNQEQEQQIGANRLNTINHENQFAKDVKLSKTYKDAFKTLDEMKKDYKEYNQWKKKFKLNEIKNRKNIEKTFFSEEELSKAQKDRNRIINSIHKLELASNNEEINFQYAIDMIIYAAKMCGVALATLFTFAIPKTSTKKTVPTNFEKTLKFGVPIVIPIFSLLVSAFLVKYQKDSAKLGRYEIKKEMLSDENSFITYDDKKRNEVQTDFKKHARTNVIKKIINDIKSIKTMPKRLNEMYSASSIQNINSTNTKKLNISEKQKQEAELLQKQLFYAFEKIDEKSEGFSDDIDALMHSIKITIGTAVNIGFNIYSLNLLTKKLKNYNENKIPGFFEGIKLMKYLNRKDLMAIFIIPYTVKATLGFIIDTISARSRKKANKIGIMTAIKDLEDERVFTKKYLQNVI